MIRDEFYKRFLVKKAELISLHKEDVKQGHFLNRIIKVATEGWTIELDNRYANDFIKKLGLETAHPVATPGSNEQKGEGHDDKKLDHVSHRLYRSCTGIAQYMSEFRMDISYAVKELAKEASQPAEGSMRRLKRLGRYLRGRPQAVLTIPWSKSQSESHTVHVVVDSDWAGDAKTRRSTSGGTAFIDNCPLKHWSTTQATISLSSAEAELKSIVKGAIEGIYIRNVLSQQAAPKKYELIVWTDSSSAKAIMQRLGTGRRAKHIDIQSLWLQEQVHNNIFTIRKVNTLDNVADMLTTHRAQKYLRSTRPRRRLQVPSSIAF